MITDKGIYPEYIKNQLEGVKPNREEDKEYEKASHMGRKYSGSRYLTKDLYPEYIPNIDN